jgi:hypothetical protein
MAFVKIISVIPNFKFNLLHIIGSLFYYISGKH